jgi:hypothetical protein
MADRKCAWEAEQMTTQRTFTQSLHQLWSRRQADEGLDQRITRCGEACKDHPRLAFVPLAVSVSLHQ